MRRIGRRLRRGAVRRAAARFISRWEGFSPVAVLDTLANPPVWTYGFGYTIGVRPGMTISRAEARELLAGTLVQLNRELNAVLEVRVTIRMRMALLSIGYNVGPGVFHDTKLINALNRGHYQEAGDRFLEWDHAGGVRVWGLTRRRRAERKMFLSKMPKRRS